jgi:hypothetical protein
LKSQKDLQASLKMIALGDMTLQDDFMNKVVEDNGFVNVKVIII